MEADIVTGCIFFLTVERGLQSLRSGRL